MKNKTKDKFATPNAIIKYLIDTNQVKEYTLGGVLSIAQMAAPYLQQLLSSNVKSNNPLQENVNPYENGGAITKGFKQYNAPSHEDGGQLVNSTGTPSPDGTNEIEKKENYYKYSSIPNKEGYVFSDKLGSAEELKTIIQKYFNKNSDLDEPTKTAMEFEIQNLERKNETKRLAQEVTTPQEFELGGPIDPLPTNPLMPVRSGNWVTPQLTTNPIQPVQSTTASNLSLPSLSLNPSSIPSWVTPQLPTNQINPVRQGNYQTPQLATQGLPTSVQSNTPTANPLLSVKTENIDPTANKGFTANLPGIDNILRTAVLGANTVGLFNKAENEQLITPDYSQADSRMNSLNANLDAARDSALSERNAVSGAIRGGASSYQSLLARELQNSANLNQANLNISLNEQQLQNQINQQVGSYEANKAVDTANRQYQNRADNLMNEANNRNIKRAILGDTLAEADRISTIKNNEQILTATVAETQALLNSIYPDFAITDEWITKAKQLSKGEIDEAEYEAFVKRQSAIKIKE